MTHVKLNLMYNYNLLHHFLASFVKFLQTFKIRLGKKLYRGRMNYNNTYC